MEASAKNGREQLDIAALDPHMLPADDFAPPGAKSKWLAAFYLCIPVGYALVRDLIVLVAVTVFKFPAFLPSTAPNRQQNASLLGFLFMPEVAEQPPGPVPVSLYWSECTLDGSNNINECLLRCLSIILQGYIFGGIIAGPLGWRAAFLIEAAAMVPFVLFCALAPPMSLRGMDTGVVVCNPPGLKTQHCSDSLAVSNATPMDTGGHRGSRVDCFRVFSTEGSCMVQEIRCKMELRAGRRACLTR